MRHAGHAHGVTGVAVGQRDQLARGDGQRRGGSLTLVRGLPLGLVRVDRGRSRDRQRGGGGRGHGGPDAQEDGGGGDARHHARGGDGNAALAHLVAFEKKRARRLARHRQTPGRCLK
ncbi:hypothetical protein D3C72_1961620 [compost metagenome]